MSKETVGEYLKREREIRQISIQDVAEGTKISLASLRLIEENRFDELPAEVFVRGFVRNYAKYIGIDPEEVIKLLEEDFKGHKPSISNNQPEITNNPTIDVGSRHSKKVIGLLAGIFLLLLVTGGIYYFFFSDTSQPPTTAANVTEKIDNMDKNEEPVDIEPQKSAPGPKILLEEEINSTNVTTPLKP